jgi:hypothetical protein
VDSAKDISMVCAAILCYISSGGRRRDRRNGRRLQSAVAVQSIHLFIERDDTNLLRS